ncbi:MAG: hypothetical protein U0V72_03100 [Cytophagales bacterium]
MKIDSYEKLLLEEKLLEEKLIQHKSTLKTQLNVVKDQISFWNIIKMSISDKNVSRVEQVSDIAQFIVPKLFTFLELYASSKNFKLVQDVSTNIKKIVDIFKTKNNDE